MQTKTLKFRIKDSSCRRELERQAKAVNFVWNYCNETAFKALRDYSDWLSWVDLVNLTSGAFKELGVHSHTIQSVARLYVSKRNQSRKRKLKWRGLNSLGWIPMNYQTYKLTEDGFVFRKKHYKLFNSKRLQDPRIQKFRAAEICQDAQDRWYFCVAVDWLTEQYGQLRCKKSSPRAALICLILLTFYWARCAPTVTSITSISSGSTIEHFTSILPPDFLIS